MIDRIFNEFPSLRLRTRSHVVAGIRILRLVGATVQPINHMERFLRDGDAKKLQIASRSYRNPRDDRGIEAVIYSVLSFGYGLPTSYYTPLPKAAQYLTWKDYTLKGRLVKKEVTEKLEKLFWSVYPNPKKLKEGLKYQLVLHWKGVTDPPNTINLTAWSVLDGIVQSKAWEDGPILADALEDGGFDDQDMLDGLRSDELFEGHWIYDLLIGAGYVDEYKIKVKVTEPRT